MPNRDYKWIPVSERLPETINYFELDDGSGGWHESDPVIVHVRLTVHDEVSDECAIAVILEDGTWDGFTCGGFNLRADTNIKDFVAYTTEVVAWMPLPPFMKEGGELDA